MTIATQGEGTTEPSPGTYSIVGGGEIQVQATPKSGWIFEGWMLNGSSIKVNPIKVVMDADAVLTAIFNQAASKEVSPLLILSSLAVLTLVFVALKMRK